MKTIFIQFYACYTSTISAVAKSLKTELYSMIKSDLRGLVRRVQFYESLDALLSLSLSLSFHLKDFPLRVNLVDNQKLTTWELGPVRAKTARTKHYTSVVESFKAMQSL